MRISQLVIVSVACCCLVSAVTTQSASVADKAIKIEDEWKGAHKEGDNKAFAKHLNGSYEGVITSSKAWTKLWSAWKDDKPVPEVDFDKYMLLVFAAPGARNTVEITKVVITDNGDLRYGGDATQAGDDGFAYHICKIKREGIKTFKGKKLSKE